MPVSSVQADTRIWKNSFLQTYKGNHKRENNCEAARGCPTMQVVTTWRMIFRLPEHQSGAQGGVITTEANKASRDFGSFPPLQLGRETRGRERGTDGVRNAASRDPGAPRRKWDNAFNNQSGIVTDSSEGDDTLYRT